MYESECLEWFGPEWDAVVHENRYLIARRKPEHVKKPYLDVLYFPQTIAAIVVDDATMRTSVSQSHMNSLIQWKAKGESRMIAVFVCKGIDASELNAYVRGFDLMVRYPFEKVQAIKDVPLGDVSVEVASKSKSIE